MLAQTADTTSAWRYLPLQVGNVWEYRLSYRECLAGICDRYQSYERWRVEGMVDVGERRYAALSVQSYFDTGNPMGSRDEQVRFDTLTARGVRRTADGTEVMWPGNISCRLSAPFDADTECDNGVFASTSSSDEVEVRVGSVTETRRTKNFSSPSLRTVYVADIGLLYRGEDFNPWEYERLTLTYARVGDLEYGAEQFPVTAESAPSESALALTVFPNPSRGDATVRFALDRPQRVTLAVFDVLGRRVLTEDLGTQPAGEATHGLDAAALPAGLYVVRLTGDAGASATAHVVRN